MERVVPEVDANGSEVVFGELVFCELHQEGTFADARAPNEDEFDQLVILLYHVVGIIIKVNLSTVKTLLNSKTTPI